VAAAATPELAVGSLAAAPAAVRLAWRPRACPTVTRPWALAPGLPTGPGGYTYITLPAHLRILAWGCRGFVPLILSDGGRLGAAGGAATGTVLLPPRFVLVGPVAVARIFSRHRFFVYPRRIPFSGRCLQMRIGPRFRPRVAFPPVCNVRWGPALACPALPSERDLIELWGAP
jgi:hypothetical protein